MTLFLVFLVASLSLALAVVVMGKSREIGELRSNLRSYRDLYQEACNRRVELRKAALEAEKIAEDRLRQVEELRDVIDECFPVEWVREIRQSIRKPISTDAALAIAMSDFMRFCTENAQPTVYLNDYGMVIRTVFRINVAKYRRVDGPDEEKASELLPK